MNLGQWGEQEACAYLVQRGYEVLERNYRAGRDELDIIARRQNLIVVFEVKTRSSNRYGYPESFVGTAKQQRMFRAAEHYLQHHCPQAALRFDVISVEKTGNTFIINHFEDAFYPNHWP
ncbi:MAG: hypothetical protein RL160_1533 [Bacteroidota bacterium]